MTLVLVTCEDGVATLTLNRPEAMNALSRALRDEDVEERGRAVMERGCRYLSPSS